MGVDLSLFGSSYLKLGLNPKGRFLFSFKMNVSKRAFSLLLNLILHNYVFLFLDTCHLATLIISSQ